MSLKVYTDSTRFYVEAEFSVKESETQEEENLIF